MTLAPMAAPFIVGLDDALLIAQEFRTYYKFAVQLGVNKINPSDQNQNKYTSLNDLGHDENVGETNMLDSVQTQSDQFFTLEQPDTILAKLDRFAYYNDTASNSVDIGNAIFDVLQAHYASYIFGVVVCHPDNLDNICNPYSHNALCCDWYERGPCGGG